MGAPREGQPARFALRDGKFDYGGPFAIKKMENANSGTRAVHRSLLFGRGQSTPYVGRVDDFEDRQETRFVMVASDCTCR